jgi:hypothetical protein
LHEVGMILSYVPLPAGKNLEGIQYPLATASSQQLSVGITNALAKNWPISISPVLPSYYMPWV